MFRRFLSLLVVLTAAAGIAASQPAQDLSIPEPCRAGINQDLPTLEKRKRLLERQIPRSLLTKTMQKRRQELLRVIFQIECVKARNREQVVEATPAAKVAAPRSAERPDHVVKITAYYATNRNLSGSSEPAKVYGSRIEPALQYGRAVVTIPTLHKVGNLELPSIWRLEFEPNPHRHFVLKSVKPLERDAVRAEIAEKLKGPDRKAVLVFVHGYYVSFSEAAMRTAQLAYDLRFQGVPLFFSWPSAGQAVAYLQDAETAQVSEAAFDQLLEDLSWLPATDIYVIAHSMGSRIVSQVLRSRVDRGKRTSHVSELLLAAPDINADLFRTAIAPKLAAMQGTRTTVYAASSDLALRASKAMHGFKRVGDTVGGVLVYPGLETIDASSASLLMRAFGHSYLMDSATVLKDIQSIIRQKLPAKQRGLVEAGTLPDVYWRLH